MFPFAFCWFGLQTLKAISSFSLYSVGIVPHYQLYLKSSIFCWLGLQLLEATSYFRTSSQKCLYATWIGASPSLVPRPIQSRTPSARMRSEGYGSYQQRYLISGAPVRPENDITYSMGNKGQNICLDFFESASLQRYTASCIVWHVWQTCSQPFWKPRIRVISRICARVR